MANRGAQKGLKQYWIWALILVIIALIVYYIAGGPSTPGPHPTTGTPTAPVVEP